MPIPAPTVHGEFSSSDATALTEPNARILLYAPGSTTALTLGSSDFVSISTLTVSSAATNATVTVYSGADATADAGEVLFSGVVATNSTVAVQFPAPVVCVKGTWPKVAASASGAVKVQLAGAIVRVGS